MEVAEKKYECRTTSKTPIRVDADRASHGRKINVGEAASSTNTEKGRAGNCKTKHVGHSIGRWTRGKI